MGLYQLMQSTCKRLEIPIPRTVISSELRGINAFATGTDQNAFVVISSMAPRFLTPKELQFILSHECGHIAMRHMVYHTAGSLATAAGGYVPVIGPAIAKTAVFPLNFWNRCSEITADRVGLICCDDIHTAQMVLLKIVGGFTEVDSIDVERYITNSRAMQNTQPMGKFGEYFQTHPIIYKRLAAMELFSHSQLYYQVAGKTAPRGIDLLSDNELNTKTDALLKVF